MGKKIFNEVSILSKANGFYTVSYNDKAFFDNVLYGYKNKDKNRVIKKAHIKECAEGWESGIDMQPVTINGTTGLCLDGNHTLQALMNLWFNAKCTDRTIDVKVISIPEEDEQKYIIEKNTHNLRWSKEQIVLKYSHSDDNYKKVVDFCNETSFTNKNGNPKIKLFESLYGAKGDILKSGNFEVDVERLNNARIIRDEIIRMFDEFDFSDKGDWVFTFVDAWKKYKEETGYTADDIIKKGKRTWNNGTKMQAKVAQTIAFSGKYKNTTTWISFFNNVTSILLKNMA